MVVPRVFDKQRLWQGSLAIRRESKESEGVESVNRDQEPVLVQQAEDAENILCNKLQGIPVCWMGKRKGSRKSRRHLHYGRPHRATCSEVAAVPICVYSEVLDWQKSTFLSALQ